MAFVEIYMKIYGKKSSRENLDYRKKTGLEETVHPKIFYLCKLTAIILVLVNPNLFQQIKVYSDNSK